MYIDISEELCLFSNEEVGPQKEQVINVLVTHVRTKLRQEEAQGAKEGFTLVKLL